MRRLHDNAMSDVAPRPALRTSIAAAATAALLIVGLCTVQGPLRQGVPWSPITTTQSVKPEKKGKEPRLDGLDPPAADGVVAAEGAVVGAICGGGCTGAETAPYHVGTVSRHRIVDRDFDARHADAVLSLSLEYE